ncbi:Condensin complex subunit [Apophysomyces sp. BC1034]|nr:Condensin complex subunit [Apophysomyces sp. BC1034]
MSKDNRNDKREIQLFSDHEEDAELSATKTASQLTQPTASFGCLFCTHADDDFDASLLHMTHTHGFFLPDAEYLVDVHGLMAHLSQKIQENICLYCNGRGKEWKSVEAVRAHMTDKGHCKMAYDESEDPDILLQFYDFEPLEETEGVIVNGSELILENGARLGHRNDLKFFKQRLQKEPSTKAIAAAEANKAATEEALADTSLNRKQRRRLLLTDGRTNSEITSQTAEGIREAVVKQDFLHAVSTSWFRMNDQFILHDELIKLQEDSSLNYYIANEVTIRDRSDHDLARYLNDITDKIEVSADAIVDPLVFDKIRSFLKNFHCVSQRISARLLDILLSGIVMNRLSIGPAYTEIKDTSDSLASNEKDAFMGHRINLELYGFLIHWLLLAVEQKASSQNAKTKKGKARATDDDGGWDWTTQKSKAFDLIACLLELKLAKIWTLTPERNTFISLFTKPAYQIFENPASAKSGTVTSKVFKVLSICIKHYEHLFASQMTIMQNLQYWEHSAEPMAALLHYLVDKQDYTQLADEILRETSNKEFKDTTVKELKDTPNAKTFAIFLLKLTELSPKTILKNLGLLIRQLDSESYAMRIAIIEVLGMLIVELTKHAEDTPANKDQINRFFDILEERMLDPISFVRSKVFQTYIRLLDLRAKFPKRRYALSVLAVRHLQDKSSSVRKFAIRVLTKLMSTHPYSMYGGELDIKDWTTRLDKLKEELGNVTTVDAVPLVSIEQPSATEQTDRDVTMQEANDVDAQTEQPDQPQDSPTETEAVPIVVSAEKMQQLTLMKTFHMDAIQFIQQIHKSIPIICQLLSSKSKAEVLEAMDFLVVAYTYKVKAASEGIKKMLHLIWTKDTSDEGKGVKVKLLECYRNLYLEMDGKLSRRNNVNNIAKNLIQLTFNTTLAELTSLEQLLSTLMAEDRISGDVIDKLWDVYGYSRASISKAQRRGAIIILGMLGKAKIEIISEKVDLLLRIGLGPLGKADLTLARYTSIALQRLTGTKSEKGRGVYEGIRFSMNHTMFTRLRDIVETPSELTEWYSMTEQAINAIYLLGEHPDVLCAEIIKEKTMKVFGQNKPDAPATTETDLPGESMDVDYDVSMSQQVLPVPQRPLHQSSSELSQLLFIVGHVALKQVVHLEIVEAAWKRKKTKTDDGKENTSIEEELEQVGGTAEDDIGDAITHIREREILFGPTSLLARFGPLLTEVCSRNRIYTDRTLQITATLALAKFMCVSSDYCEKHLQLLFTILEKSKDPTIRSNIVIALGDMAVCFNTLIDENISFLYNRLADEDTVVKKNAVMVLTHLILNGMVKVKGQISEMAKCLEDSDQRIADLAKLFFTELATKDNAIYNNLPDIISNLTNNIPKVEEETFRRIMKFIFSFEFAEKEKQAENVIDKLCQRFQNTDDTRIWRDIAFCLSLLPFKSERSFRKLLENLPSYQDKLHEESVLKSFMEVIAKGRAQKQPRVELKNAIDELEQKVEKKSGVTREEAKTLKSKKGRVAAAKPNKKPIAEKAKTRKRRRVTEDDDEEDEEDEEMEDVVDDDDIEHGESDGDSSMDEENGREDENVVDAENNPANAEE